MNTETISLLALIMSITSVITNIIHNHKKQALDIKAREPVISAFLEIKNNALFLTLQNNGLSVADNIMIDDLTRHIVDIESCLKINQNETIKIYPSEKYTLLIQELNSTILNNNFNLDKISVSFNLEYTSVNTGKKYTDNRLINTFGVNFNNVNEGIKEMHGVLSEISLSGNRLANYFNGNWLLPSDRILQPPHRTFQDDINKYFKHESDDKK